MWRTPVASALLKVSVYAFPIVAVVSSIPVFSIVIKYNLVENGFSARLGFLWGVLFPWLAAFPLLYMPNILSQFINFTSLLCALPLLRSHSPSRRAERRSSTTQPLTQPPSAWAQLSPSPTSSSPSPSTSSSSASCAQTSWRAPPLGT